MKTTQTFGTALLLLIGIALPYNASAEDFLYKTALVIKETLTYTPTAPTPPPTDPLCGTVAGTPTTATPPVSYDAYRVLTTPGDFTVVSFKIFYSDNIGGTLLNSYTSLSPATVNFNATTGEISYNMTGIAQSRKALSVVVFLNDGSGAAYDTTEFYTSQVRSDPPIGTIIPYYGAAANIAALNMGGWFLCDGTSVASISDNVLFPAEKTALTAIIGANFPDLRGLFLRGAGTNGYDPNSPRAIGSIQAEETGFSAHNYDKANSPTGSHNVSLSTTSTSVRNDAANVSVLTSATLNDGNHSHSISYTTTSTTDPSGGTRESRPDNVAVTYIIKARY